MSFRAHKPHCTLIFPDFVQWLLRICYCSSITFAQWIWDHKKYIHIFLYFIYIYDKYRKKNKNLRICLTILGLCKIYCIFKCHKLDIDDFIILDMNQSLLCQHLFWVRPHKVFFSCVSIMLTRPLSSVNYALLLTRVISSAWPHPNIGGWKAGTDPGQVAEPLHAIYLCTCAHVYDVGLWVTGKVQRQKDNLETPCTKAPGQDVQ